MFGRSQSAWRLPFSEQRYILPVVGVSMDGRRLSRAKRSGAVPGIRVAGVAVVLILILAACGGEDSGDNAGTTVPEEETAAEETTSTTEAPTTTTTATTESTPDSLSDDELAEQLMATAVAFNEAYATCLSDTAACDVEADLGSFLGQPLRGQIDTAIAQWAADGVQLRGADDEDYRYSQHDQALPNPPTYGLEICVTAGPQAVYEVDESGEETLVEDLGGPRTELRQYLLEQRPNNEFVINVSQTGDETAEGTSCDGEPSE